MTYQELYVMVFETLPVGPGDTSVKKFKMESPYAQKTASVERCAINRGRFWRLFYAMCGRMGGLP